MGETEDERSDGLTRTTCADVDCGVAGEHM
jgi:hypothetical protein